MSNSKRALLAFTIAFFGLLGAVTSQIGLAGLDLLILAILATVALVATLIDFMIRGSQSSMAVWRAFAAVSLVLIIVGLVMSAQQGMGDVWEIIGTIMAVPTAFGVVAYAFKLDVYPGRHWRWFAYVLAIWSVLAMIIGALNIAATAPDNATSAQGVGYLSAVVIIAIVSLLNWLAVWRYANEQGRSRAA
ncbi:MAG: hypothetical protein ACOH2N_15620 [Devosia sp.]